MKKLPHFKSKEEEADYWMANDTSAFWDSFESLKEPLEVSKELASLVEHRHEKTKPISIRLYTTQLRIAKAIAGKKHIPYQALLRTLIEKGLSQLMTHA
jgi:predicted DNA binding CopG/RHH family protein